MPKEKQSFQRYLALTREILAIIAIVVGVTFFFGKILTDIAIIKSDLNNIRTNELVHIQEDIIRNTAAIQENREANMAQNEILVRLETLLNSLVEQ